MRKISNEMKVALTVLAALVALFFGFRLMSDMPLFRQSNLIYSYFDRVDGLTPGNYVFINGVKVGSVKKIDLVPGDSVRVSMSFELGLDIPRGSVAYLESSGLLDEKALVIERSDRDELIGYGGVIEGEYRGGMMETLKDEGEKLSGDISESFDKLNTLLEQLNNTLTEENQGKIRDVITNLREATNDISGLLKNKRTELEQSIDHTRRFLANLDTVSTHNKERIDSVLTGLDRSLAQFEKLSTDLGKTNSQLTEILEKINRGEGSLGKMVNDSSLYDNLDSLAIEMKTLIKNINEDPRKYLKHMRLIEVF